jgi:O-antigen/teichoic acid export membrane protein
MIAAVLPRPRDAAAEPAGLWPAAFAFVGVVMLCAAAARLVSVSVSVAIFALAGGALALFTARRPALGCAVLAFAVPLTAGLGRDTVLPLLRTNEAIAACVLLGLLLHELDQRGRGRFSGLDLAIMAYTLGAIMVPTLVLFITRTPAGIDVWRTIFGPAQYVVVFWIFSRGLLRDRDLIGVLNLSLLASVIAAAIALMQLADVPGVRPFLDGVYPLGGGGEALCQYGACRPMSLLEHASAFGAYALLNYLLALALSAWRHPGFRGWWLASAMAFNAVAVIVSQTQAAFLGLVLGTALVLWHARSWPRQLGPTLAGTVIGVLLFLPQVLARIDQQFGGGGGTPQSLATRYQYWGDYFIPDIQRHLLAGTGTIIPADIPTTLVTFVDNEYLRVAYRAGLIGVALLLAMYAAIAFNGWRTRRSGDPWAGATGGAALASVAGLALMGTTAEYLTFAGVSQQFWMVIGLLAGIPLVADISRARAAVLRPAPVRGSPPATASRLQGLPFYDLGRRWASVLRPEQALVRSSAIVFSGNTLARLFGFVFAVVAARLLLPSGYGVFAYALTVANIASILVLDAPIGLARWLPRLRDDPLRQEVAFSNTVVLAAAALGVSLLVAVPGGILLGLHGGTLLGALAIVVGLACFTLYREAARGQERFLAMMAVFVLANALELAGILVAGALGRRTPTVFLFLYGLSYVAAVAILALVAPLKLSFHREAIDRRELMSLLVFVSPLFLQTAFLTAWLGADLLLVRHFLGPALTGQYAAAKNLTNVFYLIPAAVGATLMPQVARLPGGAVRLYVARALALTGVLTLLAVAVLVILRAPVIAILFGSRYPRAAAPFAILALGTGLYGIYQVLEHAWIGRGYPLIDTVATGAGMVATFLLGIVLVPRLGLDGAALAFGIGAALQLLIIGGISVAVTVGWLSRRD